MVSQPQPQQLPQPDWNALAAAATTAVQSFAIMGRELEKMPNLNLTTQINLVLNRLDVVDNRFDQLEAKFDQLDTKVDQLDTKVDQLDTKVNVLVNRVGQLEAKVDDLRGEVTGVRDEARIKYCFFSYC
jgi:outer membrane murein-binding lipoprotein Lpp